jgi:hypothetical protein
MNKAEITIKTVIQINLLLGIWGRALMTGCFDGDVKHPTTRESTLVRQANTHKGIDKMTVAANTLQRISWEHLL